MSISYKDLIRISEDEILTLESDNLIYEDTKDPEYLEQFLILRRKAFEDKGIDQVLEPEEGWDYGLDTHVLIARDGNKVVAGAIVVINNCYIDELLPFEDESIRLYKLLPEYELDKNSYAAFKQTVVDKNYRNASCLRNMFRWVYNFALMNNVKFVFAVAPESRVRMNRIAFRKLKAGLDIEIVDNIKLPKPEWWTVSEIYLQVLDIRTKYNSDVNGIEEIERKKLG